MYNYCKTRNIILGEFTLSYTHASGKLTVSLILSACGVSNLTNFKTDILASTVKVKLHIIFEKHKLQMSLKTKFKRGCRISHLKIFFYVVLFLCILLQLLFIPFSAQSSCQTWSSDKSRSSGITDECRWTVSGKVLWKTFNVFYISVSELSRNTWITQCQPNTA